VSEDLTTSHKVNVKASKMLAEFAKNNEISRFIYVSTSHVYARSNSLLTESSATAPNNVYAEQKLEAEEEISSIFRDYPEKLCIVRVFSVLDWDVADFTLGGGIKKLTSDNSNFILNYGDDIRDFLTPHLIANTLISIANEVHLTGIVNLATGIGITVKDAARTMLEGSGYKLPANRIVSGNSDYPYVVGDNSKLKAALPDLNLKWNPSRLLQPND
jgi:nucleoside-diphosphate-sugar epimerase